MDAATFLYMMVALKLPIVALLWIVWWAVHQKPEPEGGDEGDGGQKARPEPPASPSPRRPRRGPHGDPPLPSPPRVRSVVKARGRRVGARRIGA